MLNYLTIFIVTVCLKSNHDDCRKVEYNLRSTEMTCYARQLTMLEEMDLPKPTEFIVSMQCKRVL